MLHLLCEKPITENSGNPNLASLVVYKIPQYAFNHHQLIALSFQLVQLVHLVTSTLTPMKTKYAHPSSQGYNQGGQGGTTRQAQDVQTQCTARSGRHIQSACCKAGLSRTRVEVLIRPDEVGAPQRCRPSGVVLRRRVVGGCRTLRVTLSVLTIAHFDASAGTTSLSFVVPVLLSSGKGEGDVSADAGRDADRAAQARQSASQEQQQEQVSAFVVRASGASLSSIESNFVDAREILARV